MQFIHDAGCGRMALWLGSEWLIQVETDENDEYREEKRADGKKPEKKYQSDATGQDEWYLWTDEYEFQQWKYWPEKEDEKEINLSMSKRGNASGKTWKRAHETKEQQKK